MFQKAGPVSLIIGDVKFAESKFGKGPNDFDVCVQVTDAGDAAQTDWWRGEMSQNYGKGNFSTMKQTEITMRTLRNCGFQGDDLTTIAEQLTGKTVPGMIKASAPTADGKVFYNVQYIGAGGAGNAPEADKVIAAADINERLKALCGEDPTATAPAANATTTPPTATTAQKKPSVFGKKTAFPGSAAAKA